MGSDANNSGDTGAHGLHLSRWAWLPLPVLVAAMGAFWAADWQRSHESVYLLLILNIVFSLLVCLVVAYLIARSFLVRSAPGLLLFGCGVVIWGPAGVVATAAARGDANLSITIYNGCVWLSALCHLAGVSLSLRPRQPLSPPVPWLLTGYAHAIGAVALVTLLALAGWVPAFYIEERGGTPVRQVILFSAIIMFALTALLLGVTRRKHLSAFAYWYALALLLIAAGLLGVALQTYHASILGWTGRATQALGGLYMLIAAVASVRESRVWGISLEGALRESEDRYRTLFDTAPDAIVVHRTGRLLHANDAALRLAGAGSFQELAAHTILDFFPLTERKQAAERVRLAQTGQRQPIRETTLLRLDGREVAAELHTGPIDFQGGPAVQTIIRDITDRKRAEEQLRRSQEMYRAIVEDQTEFVTRFLPGGEVLFMNEAGLAYFHKTKEEVYGKSFLASIPKEEWARLQREIGKLSPENPIVSLEHSVLDGNGRVRVHHWINRAIFDRDGRIVEIQGVGRDITERKQAEEALRQALADTQRRCAEISALMTCTRAVLECRDLVSATRAVFNACRELLGAPAGYVALLGPDGENNDVLLLEAGGLSCTVDPSLPMPVRGFRAEAYRLGRVVYENDFAQSRWAELLPPGHVRLENVLFAPLVIDGRTVGLLGLGNKPGGFTDHDAALAVTFGELVAIALRNYRTLESLWELNATLERKVAERTAELEHRARQLQKLTLELSQAQERESRRVAEILHEDLQQQIAGAKFQLNLLCSRIQDDPSHRLTAAQINQILKDAIGMSRSLSHELSPAVFYDNDLGEALGWLGEHTEAKYGVTVTVEVSGEGILHSEVLTVFLFRAARELLSNAVRHAGVREAAIRLRQVGRYVALRVSDQGRGFDPHELRETSGFGLLSIRERVELLGGRVKIASAAGRGTRVRIVVPDGSEGGGQRTEDRGDARRIRNFPNHFP